jgi:hypothetical protein
MVISTVQSEPRCTNLSRFPNHQNAPALFQTVGW